MNSDESKPKRMGRPPKAPEKGRRQNYTFRMSEADRDLLLAAAAKSGRSISEEIEARVSRSLGPDLALRQVITQYYILLEHIGGEKNVFATSVLNSIFRIAVERATGSDNAGYDWLTSEEHCSEVKASMKASMDNFVESLKSGSKLIDSYSRMVAITPDIPKIKEAMDDALNAYQAASKKQ